jgi:hypothetical protein
VTHATEPAAAPPAAARSTSPSDAVTDDTSVLLPLDLDALVTLLTRSVLTLHADRPDTLRPTYGVTGYLEVGDHPAATWVDHVATGRPVGVRSSVGRVTAGAWAPGALVAGAVANVERAGAELRVEARPPSPGDGASVPDVVHLPVDLLGLVTEIEVAPDQPSWLRQAVAGAVQAAHHHGLRITVAEA